VGFGCDVEEAPEYVRGVEESVDVGADDWEGVRDDAPSGHELASSLGVLGIGRLDPPSNSLPRR